MRYVLIAIGVLCFISASAAMGEVKMTPDEQRTITAIIQEFGYNCPLAKSAWYKGADAHGFVLKVYCGPTDRDGIYERAVFRFTRLPNETVSVEPWRDD